MFINQAHVMEILQNEVLKGPNIIIGTDDVKRFTQRYMKWTAN